MSDAPAHTRQAAGVLLQNHAGQVLLVKHNYGLRRYSVPGGAVEPDETPQDTAVREALEEIGVRVELGERFGTYLIQGMDRPPIWVHIFRAEVTSGEPRVVDPDEIASLHWVDGHTPPSPLTTDANAVLTDLLTGRSGLEREVWREL